MAGLMGLLPDWVAWVVLAAAVAAPFLLILWILIRFPLKPPVQSLSEAERARIKAAAARNFGRTYRLRGADLRPRQLFSRRSKR